MRRFVALLLLVLLPLQAVWAAVAPHCQHEGEATSHHLGHHLPELPHPAAAEPADAHEATAPLADPASDTTSTHSHCHGCHGSTLLAHEVSLVRVTAAAAPPVPARHRGLPAPPSARPERPQWPALA